MSKEIREWLCQHCGTVNTLDQKTCVHCGAGKNFVTQIPPEYLEINYFQNILNFFILNKEKEELNKNNKKHPTWQWVFAWGFLIIVSLLCLLSMV